MNKKKFAVFGGIAVLMIAFVIIAAKNKPDVEETIGGYKEGKRVQVEYVKQDDIETKISASGKLEAIHTKTIYLDGSNKIVQLHKKVGDTVQKGELIITLDKEAKISNEKQLDVLETKLAVANEGLNELLGSASKGEVLSAQSNIEQLKNSRTQTEKSISDAKTTIENLKKQLSDTKEELQVNEALLAEGLVSQKEVDVLKDTITQTKQKIDETIATVTLSEQSLKTIDLQIETAQYNLDVLLNKVEDSSKEQAISAKQSEIKEIERQIYESKMSLSKTSMQVVAPIDGVITVLPAEEGMSVAAGTAILTIVDPSSLKVTCNISPYYAADLKTGLMAEVKYIGSKTVEVVGEVIKVSAIAEVEKTASGETTSIPVEVQINEPGEIIRPGFSVNVKLITDTRNDVCLVPILAVLEEEDLSYVYIVGEDGTLEKREIEQGLSNGLYVEANNVKPGELIVSSLEDFLEDGVKVSYEKIGELQ